MRRSWVVNAVVLSLWLPAAQGDQTLLAEYHHAWELVGQLRTKEAIPLLDSIIAREKTFHLAYSTLARAYYFSGSVAAGEKHFRRLIENDPHNGLAHFGLGMLYAYLRNTDSARREMAACIQSSPPKPHLYVCYSEFPPTARFEDLPERVKKAQDDPYANLIIATHFSARSELVTGRSVASAGLARARTLGHRGLEGAYLIFRASSLMDDQTEMMHTLRSAVPIVEDQGDRDLEMRLVLQLANCLKTLHQWDRADEVLSKAQASAEHWGYLFHAGALLSYRGNLREAQGNLVESLRFNTRAKQMLEPYPPDAMYFEVLRHLGDANRRLGRISEAVAEYEGLRQTAIRLKWPAFEGYALRYLGDLYAEAGDYFKALDHQTRSFTIFDELGRTEPNSRNTSGASLTRIGKIYAALGEYETAKANFRRALQIAVQHNDWDPQQRVQIELGNLLLRTKQPREALEALAKARAAGDKTLQPTFEPPTLLNMGRAYRELNQWPEAVRHMTDSLRAAERLGMKAEQSEALSELGAAHLRAGDLSLADQCLSQSLTLAETLDSLRLIVPARLGLADLEEARGNRPQSLGHLLSAIQALEEIRNRIPGSSLRAGMQSQSWVVYERALELLAEEGKSREAFRLAESSRARTFLDLLAEGGAQITKGLSRSERERHSSLTAAVSRASAVLLNDSSPAKREAVKYAERQLREWVTETYRTNPQYSQLRYPLAYDIEQAKHALTDGETALIEYAVGENRSQVWLVRQSGFVMASLPGRKIVDSAVSALRESISRPPKGAAAFQTHRAASEALYGMLLAPLEAQLRGVRRLLIVPDGMLHHLPFETLRHNGRYLVEDFTIAYAPSVSVYGHLVETWAHKKRPLPRRELLALGDSVYGQGSDTVRSVLERSGVSLGRLPYSRTEVETIAALFPPAQRKTYLGAEATEGSLKQESLSQFRRIHFATHAIVDERMPIRSGILLSAGSSREDGLLTMAEIFNLQLDADLVVLSACQTGLGQLVRGEGMVGLTRAFFYAGSPRIAVSLWEVNDLATARLMAAFYREMQAGEPPAAALRLAKLNFLHGTADGLKHPYFWAPFVLVGLF